MAYDVSTPARTADRPATPPSAAPAPARGPSALASLGWVPTVGLVMLAAVAPLTAQAESPGPGQLLLGGCAGLTLFCALIGDGSTARLGLCLTAIGAATVLPWQVSWWPIPGVVGLCVYFVAHNRARLHPSGPPALLRRGRIGVRDCLCVLGLVLTSATALLVFGHFFPPRLSAEAGFLATLASGPLAMVGLGFSMLNAFVEETLFRGVILYHLQRRVGPWLAVGLQAVVFGMLHLDGYPYGPVGVALAGAYGVLLGVLRMRTGGLLACWMAHVCADVLIFAVIAGLLR